MVIAGDSTFTGCVIEAKPLGLFQMRDEAGVDHKILAVPVRDPQWNWMQKLEDVPRHLLLEIEHFFSIYKDLEQKKVVVDGWQDRTAALR